MASLKTRVEELATAVGTDYKQLLSWLFGTNGALTDLQTSDKSSIVAAINEARTTGGSGAPPDASETVKGVVELATTAEATTGTDTARALTPAGGAAIAAALKAEILGGAGPAFDTLNELYALVQSAEESTDIANLVTLIGEKADIDDVYNKTQIGNPDTDFVAVYNAAKTA